MANVLKEARKTWRRRGGAAGFKARVKKKTAKRSAQLKKWATPKNIGKAALASVTPAGPMIVGKKIGSAIGRRMTFMNMVRGTYKASRAGAKVLKYSMPGYLANKIGKKVGSYVPRRKK